MTDRGISDGFKATQRAARLAAESFEVSQRAAEKIQGMADLMEQVRENSAAVLRAFKSYRQMTDAMLAVRTAGELSRSTVASYTSGQAVLNVEKMAAFAKALQVTPKVFFDSPDDALRWTIDNSPNPPPSGPAPTSKRPKRPPTPGVTSRYPLRGLVAA